MTITLAVVLCVALITILVEGREEVAWRLAAVVAPPEPDEPVLCCDVEPVPVRVLNDEDAEPVGWLCPSCGDDVPAPAPSPEPPSAVTD